MKPFVKPGAKTCTPECAGAPIVPTVGSFNAIKKGSADFWASRDRDRPVSPWRKKKKLNPSQP